MNNDLNIIIKRMNALFKRVSQTHYWIEVANDKYDKQFNFFFNSQHRKQRLRSIPLHSLNNYDLNYLEKIINEFKLHSNLTINFVGFTDLKWPKSNQLIQRKRDLLE
ncbi:hypothetical protein [Fructilactobacillus florum]|uniref:Acetyl-CoA carboxylase n=1 Tax=Fructilactobacillus florum DSM 22689 = JCM 16035 TaxID=1423745 RepID=A0A0R2CJA3_9LACO|nr:hypothetical protein [Fructilactobacillus florum]KRM91727.1 hypothetical protein FC87_GL000551 [Fructilactobacillus florum DSM 22689 = JCM 16035]